MQNCNLHFSAKLVAHCFIQCTFWLCQNNKFNGFVFSKGTSTLVFIIPSYYDFFTLWVTYFLFLGLRELLMDGLIFWWFAYRRRAVQLSFRPECLIQENSKSWSTNQGFYIFLSKFYLQWSSSQTPWWLRASRLGSFLIFLGKNWQTIYIGFLTVSLKFYWLTCKTIFMALLGLGSCHMPSLWQGANRNCWFSRSLEHISGSFACLLIKSFLW